MVAHRQLMQNDGSSSGPQSGWSQDQHHAIWLQTYKLLSEISSIDQALKVALVALENRPQQHLSSPEAGASFQPGEDSQGQILTGSTAIFKAHGQTYQPYRPLVINGCVKRSFPKSPNSIKDNSRVENQILHDNKVQEQNPNPIATHDFQLGDENICLLSRPRLKTPSSSAQANTLYRGNRSRHRKRGQRSSHSKSNRPTPSNKMTRRWVQPRSTCSRNANEQHQQSRPAQMQTPQLGTNQVNDTKHENRGTSGHYTTPKPERPRTSAATHTPSLAIVSPATNGPNGSSELTPTNLHLNPPTHPQQTQPSHSTVLNSTAPWPPRQPRIWSDLDLATTHPRLKTRFPAGWRDREIKPPGASVDRRKWKGLVFDMERRVWRREGGEAGLLERDAKGKLFVNEGIGVGKGSEEGEIGSRD